MDELELATQLLRVARGKGVRIATAESCTGGLLSGAITQIAGSSDIFDRGYVTYSNQAKIDMLGVSPATLNTKGAVSPQTATEMAEGALQKSGADIAISITGVAGPGPSEFKPEGRVCFGIAAEGQKTITQTVELGALGRSQVRQASVLHALQMLINALAAQYRT